MKAWFVGNKKECADEEYCGDFIRANTRNEAKKMGNYAPEFGLNWTEFTATRQPELDNDSDQSGEIPLKEVFIAGMYSYTHCDRCGEMIHNNGDPGEDQIMVEKYDKINKNWLSTYTGPGFYSENGLLICCSQECMEGKTK